MFSKKRTLIALIFGVIFCSVKVCYSLERPSTKIVDVPLFGLTNYTTEDGLPSNEVYSFALDKNGFIWIATDNGLCKFDSEQFQVFTKKDGLPENVVLKVKTTDNGQISGYTLKNKLFIIDDINRINEINYPKKLTDYTKKFKILDWHVHDSLSCQLFLSNWNPWDEKKLPYIVYTKFNSDSASLTKFIENDYDFLYGGMTPSKHWIFNPFGKEQKCGLHKSGSFTKITDCNFSKPIRLKDFRDYKRSECVALTESQWAVSVNKSLYILDSNINSVDYVTSFETTITCLEKISNSLLVGLNHKAGLIRIEGIKSGQTSYNRMLKGVTISDLFADTSQNLWIGTLENGVYFKSNSAFEPITFPQAYSNLHQNNDRLYCILGQNEAYEMKLKGNQWSFEIIYKAKSDQNINEFWCDNNKFCYSCENPKNQIQFISKGIVNNTVSPIRSAGIISLENGYYISHAPNGWRIINMNGLPISISKSLNKRSRVFDFIKYDDSSFLAGTINGVIKCNLKNERSNYLPKLFTENERINCIAKHQETFLFGSNSSGVYVINEDTLTQTIDLNDFFLNNCITDILLANNVLWVSTKKGLASFQHNKELGKYTILKSYNKKSGLPNESIANIYSHDHLILVETPIGLFSLDPSLEIQPMPSKMFVHSIHINDELTRELNDRVLKPDHDDITISYGSQHYGIKQTTYWYR
ncbi:MAG: hypothetical protein KDC92_14635, partial [Bacteroidetes bacterium]|nr:hypothetical protein [Bacteroidota bacterium]